MNTNTLDPRTEAALRSTILRGNTNLNHLCSLSSQHVITCVDVSGSMDGAKMREAQRGVNELVAELAVPMNRDAFLVSVISFNHAPKVECTREKAAALRPLSFTADGGTDIGMALEAVHRLLQGPAPSDPHRVELRPVVILFTDGDTTGDPLTITQKIKPLADIVTVAYGTDANESLLRQIASSPQHFYRVSSHGSELRAFLKRVGSTLSQSIISGQSATQTLTQL